MNSTEQKPQSDSSGKAAPVGESSLVPNPQFTLPARRLAGSSNCLNCGTGLQGPFCHYCGQPDRNFMRFFPVLLRELMQDFMDLDSRFARTLKPLLLKPGKLTRDYLNGRRFRYTPPMRLYLFSSIAFFLLAALASFLTMGDVGGDVIVTNDDTAAVEPLNEEQARELEEAMQGLSPELKERVRGVANQATEIKPEQSAASEEVTGSANEEEDDFDIQFNGEPWDAETNPVVIPLMPERFNNWLNEEIGKSPQKAEEISEDPRGIIGQMLDLLPATIFIMLPLVALIFKFWYLFSGRYYIEHLVLALHNHSFIFVCLILLLALESMEAWFGHKGMAIGETLSYSVNFAIVAWIPVYLVLSLRRVYGQSWWLTLAKAALIGFSHFFLLVIVTAMVGILGFLLL